MGNSCAIWIFEGGCAGINSVFTLYLYLYASVCSTLYIYICMVVCDNFLTSVDDGVYFLLFIFAYVRVYSHKRKPIHWLFCLSVCAHVSDDHF